MGSVGIEILWILIINIFFIIQQIREELGEFDYDEETNHGEYLVEYRTMVELENHAKYDGEW